MYREIDRHIRDIIGGILPKDIVDNIVIGWIEYFHTMNMSTEPDVYLMEFDAVFRMRFAENRIDLFAPRT